MKQKALRSEPGLELASYELRTWDATTTPSMGSTVLSLYLELYQIEFLGKTKGNTIEARHELESFFTVRIN